MVAPDRTGAVVPLYGAGSAKSSAGYRPGTRHGPDADDVAGHASSGSSPVSPAPVVYARSVRLVPRRAPAEEKV
ncbi:hypothetical protein AF335_20680 [Streptomyces eurocidicus]|uniref:Uncharacterized protein n=1 Tax=Streptomyces eurocidicus TaxID=66423 RepID=A0A2N8NTR2_STREU|nr:hypothetical protein AF335_20680 [Streptomyces eurocidicus]